MVMVPLFHEHRILTQVAGHHVNVIKALPPLTISEQDLRRFATALVSVLEDAEAADVPQLREPGILARAPQPHGRLVLSAG